jgi:hypothetical protein
MTTAQINDAQAGTLLLDQSAAIQAAINSLPARGGTIVCPPGAYRLDNTLQIGNGTSTTPSSINGVCLRGEGSAWGVSAYGPPGNASPVVFKLFGTAHSGSIIQINGPILGAGLENISFQFDASVAAGPTARAIADYGCSFGNFQNISVLTPRDIGILESTVKGAAGAQRNTWRNVLILLDNTISLPTAAAIVIAADTSSGSTDRAFDSWENVNIIPSNTQQCGVELQYVDSIKFWNLSINPVSVDPPVVCTALLFNYLAQSPYPNGCVFYGIDVYGNVVSNAGTAPTNLNYLNRIYGFSQDNGAPIPSLTNLRIVN